jgi:hypothetical protein
MIIAKVTILLLITIGLVLQKTTSRVEASSLYTNWTHFKTAENRLFKNLTEEAQK